MSLAPSGRSAIDLDAFLGILDDIVNELFSVGLALNRAAKAEGGAVHHEVRESLERLDTVIGDIRVTAMDMRPKSTLDEAIVNLTRAQASIDLLTIKSGGHAAIEASQAVRRALLALFEVAGH